MSITPEGREIQKTEDPNSSTITITEPCGAPPSKKKKIRLWTADFKHLATWCHDCNRFHHIPEEP